MVSIPWYGLVLITAVLSAIINIIKKHVLNHEHALEQMAAETPFRMFAILFLIPFVEIPTLEQAGMIIITATILFFTILYTNKSYRHLPISTVAPLRNLSPLFLFVIAIGLLGERINTWQFLGIGLLMIGGYLLDLQGKDVFAPLRHAAKSKYSATVIVMLMFMSILGALDKINLQELAIPSFSYLFWLYLVYSILSFSAHSIQYGNTQILDDIKKGGKWLALTGALTVIEISILYYALAIPGVLIILVVPLRRTATLIETFVGGKIFGEKRLAQKVFASCVMILGVFFIV